MTIYQKVIKVRKVCDTMKQCNIDEYNCPYNKYCLNSNIILLSPIDESIEKVAKAIIFEKWEVK